MASSEFYKKVTKRDLRLIANKKLEDATITKVWKDTEGNIHVELSFFKEN